MATRYADLPVGTPVRATIGETVLVGTIKGYRVPGIPLEATYDIAVPGVGFFRIRLADGWTVEPNITVPTKPWAIVARKDDQYFYTRRPDGAWISSGGVEYPEETVNGGLRAGNFTVVSEGIN